MDVTNTVNSRQIEQTIMQTEETRSANGRLQSLLDLLTTSFRETTPILQECSQTEAEKRFWINPFENRSSWVDIGGVRVQRPSPVLSPELVPFNVPYLGSTCDFDCREIRQHLRWMMQKELLEQDMFLIGPPGPYRRWLAFMFCEFIGRPASYIALTRDTSESDLKQRREIRNSSAIYEDLLVVKAASEGHVLIIEGIEKCERNVLPVLNNLLENREMLLEDGRFLVNHKRYDALVKESGGSTAQLEKLHLIRAHPNFRVIALGLPVPQFPGNPMDPPLRSRFQCRDIVPCEAESHLLALNKLLSQQDKQDPHFISLLNRIVTFTEALQQEEMGEESRLPHFPDTPGLLFLLRLILSFPHSSIERMVNRIYPHSIMLDESEQCGVLIAIKKFLHVEATEALLAQTSKTVQIIETAQATATLVPSFYQIESVERCPGSSCEFQVRMKDVHTKNCVVNTVYGGVGTLCPTKLRHSPETYFQLAYHSIILSEMIQDHSVGKDMCILGEKGIGKSSMVALFSSSLGYSPSITMHLYQDMSARDLLQRRSTLPNGDTVWEMTPLISAAIHGGLAVLDGIDRLDPSTFSILQRLCQDRECNLFDGTVLVRKDRFDRMLSYRTPNELSQQKIIPIHPNFRIIGIANVPIGQRGESRWLTSELLPFFHFHTLPFYTHEEACNILVGLFPRLSVENYIMPLLFLNDFLRRASTPTSSTTHTSLWTAFTFRQIIRLCKRWSVYPLVGRHGTLLREIHENGYKKDSLHALHELIHSGVPSSVYGGEVEVLNIEERKNEKSQTRELWIGHVSCPIHSPNNMAFVPRVNFYNMPTHVLLLQRMLQDFVIKEPILLIGPQGVGKNMLADRLLELLHWEREYVQLHRDTTVQSLTLSPTLKGGVITWEDSALVSAVRTGRCLVVDEADKAPLEVICILKGLIEDGEMLLSNGKRILSQRKINEAGLCLEGEKGTKGTKGAKTTIIPIHPHFRIIVLANKQGYPFLGNDLMKELGDCFSCHMIGNPTEASELELLRFYGPTVSNDILVTLTQLFSELRALVDEGLLSYPYSTRELVHIVKHLEKYPEDGLITAIENVFSFDGYDSQLNDHLVQVFHKHGLPVGANTRNRLLLHTAPSLPLPPTQAFDHWHIGSKESAKEHVTSVRSELDLKGIWNFSTDILQHPQPIPSLRNSRIKMFTEEMYSWKALEGSSGTRIVDFCSLPDHSIHVLLNDPMKIISYDQQHRTKIEWDIVSHLRYSSMPNLSDFPFRFNLIALPHSHSICLYIPSFETAIILDVHSGRVKVISLDTAEGSVALYNDIIYLGFRRQLSHASRKEKESVVICEEWCKKEDCLLLYRSGDSFLRIIQFSSSPHQAGWNTKIDIPHTMIQDVSLLERKGGLETKKEFLLRDFQNRLSYHLLHWDEHGCFIESSRMIQNAPIESVAYKWIKSGRISSGDPHLLSKSPHFLSIVSEHPISFEEDDKMLFLGIEREKEEKSSFLVLHSFYLFASSLLLHVMIQPHLGSVSPFLFQFIDHKNGKYRTLEIPRETNKASSRTLNATLESSPAPPNCWVEELGDGRIAFMEESGRIRVLEVETAKLQKSFANWKILLGNLPTQADAADRLTMTLEYDGNRELTKPKEGKPTDGNEHHGGNTWQEGSGGADTAGMGGKGGPYRKESSAKFDIHQISAAAKNAISEEAKQARMEMAEEMKRKKLAQLEMSEFSHSQYKLYFDAVRMQVGQLRVIVESVRAKQMERAWLRHKKAGELDDMKLVDGLVGERNVYKQRGDIPPSAASFQQKPKRLHFTMDVSGSMYRFNGQDKRLDRLLETVCMTMESFSGYENKYSYSIAGHSGDGPHIPFVDYEKPPVGPKERLKVIEKMKIHTEYCSSGDSTVEALRLAMRYVVEKPGDDYFVFLVSDANLSRYQISPKVIAEWMNSDKRVHCYAIFIASVGDEAEKLTKELPAGKAFVCLNTSMLPSIFKQIFTSSLIQ